MFIQEAVVVASLLSERSLGIHPKRIRNIASEERGRVERDVATSN